MTFLLRYDDDAVLHLHDVDSRMTLAASFDGGSLGYRRRQHVGSELLVKAAGGLRASGRSVIDATAGLGGDALLLATAGFHVTMIERSPVVAALLMNALDRAADSADPELRRTASCMQLYTGNAAQWLGRHRSDVVCLDPMFPPRRKSARVRKEMFLLGKLLAAEDQGEALLEPALRAADNRVVVKRPRLAPCLAGMRPDWQLSGRSTRFDVYSVSSGQ
ncbi:MAG: class I SAM-dependent methyltransferase [Pseudohongiellaceae bacterium]